MRGLRDPLRHPAAIFVALVLAPSLLLGWFSLRAVENERAAARRRVLEDQERYAEFAGRAVRAELGRLEAAWEALVPRSVGWESRLDGLRAALEAARGRAFVRATHLLHVSGRQLHPAPDSSGMPTVQLSAPDVAAAGRIRELLGRAEEAEFDAGDSAVALGAYRRILATASTPNLRAIAHAGIGRVLLQRREPDGAIREYGLILRLHPEARDLDNQPLRVHAQLGIARAQESKGDPLAAARTLIALYGDLADRSDEIGRLEYDILAERIETRMARLVPRPVPPAWEEVERRFAAARAQPKKQVGATYFVHKLSRKLLRASLEELPYSTPPRYLSEAVEGEPFLLAYLFLPDARGTAVAGLVGLEIDVRGLAGALLPGALRRLEPAPDVGLAVVDESGRLVIGGEGAAGAEWVARSGLGVPFDFWNVAVFLRPGGLAAAGMDFRTKVYLYVVLLLLVTVGAGAALGVAALRRQARLARQRTSFVSGVSHELRTPLTSILLHTETLEMGMARMGEGERARSLGTIRRECERLQRLIDTVLDFARIERGAKQYRFEYEEIGSLARGVAEEFRPHAEAEGCRYEVSIEPDLPEVRVDADAVRRMLLNLLSNAVKYSDSERHVALRIFRRAGELALQVEDHGIGIDPGEQRRIFDEFYRVDALSSRRTGVGLGLTLVRRLAEAHGGRVTVESERGRGSRFTVWLPLESATGHEAAAGDGVAEARGG
jgi:signal transduction histidine kinase